jgi:putative tricarboxylic transport membrane protein
MDTLGHIFNGFNVALMPINLWYTFLGCFMGTIIGILPGIGPAAGIGLLIPITFGMDPTSALIMMAGIYYGAMYGGSTTSILINTPGEASSVMTALDGYQMAKKAAQARRSRCRRSDPFSPARRHRRAHDARGAAGGRRAQVRPG